MASVSASPTALSCSIRPLADVEAKIAAENAKAKGSGHTVTVALLSSLTANDTSTLSTTEVRNSLEGAYTAQHRVNQPGVVGDARPLIRLVLANEGSHENQWRRWCASWRGWSGMRTRWSP